MKDVRNTKWHVWGWCSRKEMKRKPLVNGETWQWCQWVFGNTPVIVFFLIIGDWHKISLTKTMDSNAHPYYKVHAGLIWRSLQILHLAGLHSISQFLYWMANQLSVLVKDVDLLHYSQQLPEHGRTLHKKALTQKALTKTNLHLQQCFWKYY